MAALPRLACATAFLLAALPAIAADGWQEAASGSVAILPPPLRASGIVGASLSCSEQRWQFLFRMQPRALAVGWKGTARISIAATDFEGEATEARGALAMALPWDMLEPLKAGSRMEVAVGIDMAGAEFSLSGSRDVIDAIAPRCSQVDVSAYSPVALSETSPDLETARALLADEARLFRAATSKRAVFAAARLDLSGERKLLFASLCGSTAYYGRSGCSLFGFATEGEDAKWREVYNTEGLLLHFDPQASNGGWPNLVTLPLARGTEPDHWTWNGSEYELVELLMGSDQENIPEGDADP